MALARFRKVRFFPAAFSAFIGICLLVELSYFFFFAFKGTLGPGHLSAYADSAEYYRAAKSLYSNLSLETFLAPHDRTIFAWPIIIFLKFFHISLTYNQLCLVNELFPLFPILTILIFLANELEVGPLCGVLTFMAYCSMQVVFRVGDSFMADQMATLICLAFLFQIAKALSSKSFCWIWIYSLILSTVIALHTKPVCLLWMFVVSCVNFPIFLLKLRPFNFKKVSLLLAFVILLLLSVYEFMPLGLLQLIKKIHYYNEVLDDYQTFFGFWDNLFWIPTSLKIHTSRFFLWAQLVPFALSLVTIFALKKLTKKRFFSYVGILLPIGAFCLYSCFFLKTKDARTLLFIFPLIILSLNFFIFKAWRRVSGGTSLVFGVCFFAYASICVYDVSNFAAYVPFETLEASGVSGLMDMLRTDYARAFEKRPRPTKSGFLLMSAFDWYMHVNILSNFNLSMSDLGQPEDLSGFAFSDGVSRFGTWNRVGGIPPGFYTATYIVTPLNPLEEMAPRRELVNPVEFFLETRLAAHDGDYTDGLILVGSIATKRTKFCIYRRERMPSREKFQIQVAAMIPMDPQNLWNYPYLKSLGPLKSPELERIAKNFETTISGGRLPKYLKDPNGQWLRPWIAKLASKNFNDATDWEYPDFLKNGL